MLREVYYPSPELLEMITHYVVIEFDNNVPDIPCTLPKGACALAIVYSNEIPTYNFSNPQHNFTGFTFITGYTLKAVKLGFIGKIKGIIAFFTPMGVWRLFGYAPIEFVDKFISVEEVAGSKTLKIIDQLKNAKNTCQEAFYFDLFLKGFIKPKNKVSCICKQSTDFIQNKYGNLRIDELVTYLNQNSRIIDRHFEKYLGVTPKQYAWLTRLNAAFTIMMYCKDISVHEIILNLGYYDQAHLINDVKKYLGYTPQVFKDHILTSIISSYSDNFTTNTTE